MIKNSESCTLPIKWSEAGQPEATALCKLGRSLFSNNAEMYLVDDNKSSV